jgi:hypothetical protein
VDAISELPLEFPADVATRRQSDKVRQAYDAARQHAGNDPKWVVIECSVTNSLSAEQLKFYGVPEATYLWQIKTEEGVNYAGVLTM